MTWPLFLFAVAFGGGPGLPEGTLLKLANARGEAGKIAEADKLLLAATRLHFSRLNDEELCNRFARIVAERRYGSRSDSAAGPASIEGHLREMLRRGGPVAEKALQARVDRQTKAMQSGKPDRDGQPYNLEVLTALRRLQGQPDPVRIEVNGERDLESIFPNLPKFGVALVNRDGRKLPVSYCNGGDYRSGRLERWRFAITSVKGKATPAVFGEPIRFGGGLFAYSVLEPGQKWNTVLDARNYVELVPGNYSIRIQYHDSDELADRAWLGGRIVCQSDEIRLHVQPRVIDIAKADRLAAAGWIAKLESAGTVKVLAGSYGKDSHEFLPPESPAGRLLALGWKAVPPLLDAVTDGATPPVRRAWILGLLHSITSYHSPLWADGVLPNYRSQSAGWAVWYGNDGAMSSGGLGSGGTSSGSGKIEPEKQLEFARRWESFRKHVVARDAD